MDRSSRRRVRKAEEFLSLAKAKRQEQQKKEIEAFVRHARLHATAVAAIVLLGQPKIDEPLLTAWKRVLQHCKIQVSPQYERYPEILDFWSRVNEQERVAEQLAFVILKDGEEVEGDELEGNEEGDEVKRLSEILKTAPDWLLAFTNTYLNRGFLPRLDLPPWFLPRLDLPPIARLHKWGADGYEASVDWPALPLGTMTDGDPVSDEDARRWPGRLTTTKESDTTPDCEDNVSGKHEGNDSAEFDRLCDMSLAMQVGEHPEKEKELSRYQRLRLRRLSRC